MTMQDTRNNPEMQPATVSERINIEIQMLKYCNRLIKKHELNNQNSTELHQVFEGINTLTSRAASLILLSLLPSEIEAEIKNNI